MNKSWIVARHEFAMTVKRIWFIIATFVLPLIILSIYGVSILLSHQAIAAAEHRIENLPLGIIDRWGGLTLEPKDADLGFTVRRFTPEQEDLARDAMKEGEISAYVLVPSSYLTHPKRRASGADRSCRRCRHRRDRTVNQAPTPRSRPYPRRGSRRRLPARPRAWRRARRQAASR